MEWFLGLGGILAGAASLLFSMWVIERIGFESAIRFFPPSGAGGALLIGVGLVFIGALSCLHFRWATWGLLALSWFVGGALIFGVVLSFFDEHFLLLLLNFVLGVLIIWPGAFYVHLTRRMKRDAALSRGRYS